MLDATSVIVYLRESGASESTVWRQTTIAVPANSVVNAIFGDITQDRTTRYDLRVEVAGEEANNVEDISPSELKDGGVLDFGIQYNAASSGDGDSIWLTLAIVALGLLVIYGGVRTARSRGGTKF